MGGGCIIAVVYPAKYQQRRVGMKIKCIYLPLAISKHLLPFQVGHINNNLFYRLWYYKAQRQILYISAM